MSVLQLTLKPLHTQRGYPARDGAEAAPFGCKSLERGAHQTRSGLAMPIQPYHRNSGNWVFRRLQLSALAACVMAGLW